MGGEVILTDTGTRLVPLFARKESERGRERDRERDMQRQTVRDRG